MWVESTIGLGSKFYFNVIFEKSNELISCLEEANLVTSNISNKKVDINNVKILLVEDNELNIEITKKILNESNYHCDVSKDGILAIKQIKDLGVDYYDLILMDIHMPKYNGYEISKILKKDLCILCPIVALTATNITNDIIEENSEYIIDYIQKPVRPEVLKEKIKNHLNIADSSINKNTSKKNLLILGNDISSITLLKNIFQKYFDVAITKSQQEAKILLETEFIDLIVIDESSQFENQFEFINSIKNNSNSSKIAIIVVNEFDENDFTKKIETLPIDGIVMKHEISKADIITMNIFNKLSTNSRLNSELKKEKEEVENVYNFLFESMVKFTSSKSKETGEHLQRTKEYMTIMLDKYESFYQENLFTNRKKVEDISTAAVLHDIGKVGIPDNILHKPDKLTDEEYSIIKSHVLIGKEILETSYSDKISNEILEFAKDLVYHHHEKFDGTGYPEKLKGDEISIISRIMGIIDVYDALVNDRIYKKAMPYDEVEEYINSQSGKAFDPKIVTIFNLAKDTLRKINDKNKDKI